MIQELAPKHLRTLFLRTSVANAPFLVAKFGVQVLPCVMVFVDGRCVDRWVDLLINLVSIPRLGLWRHGFGRNEDLLGLPKAVLTIVQIPFVDEKADDLKIDRLRRTRRYRYIHDFRVRLPINPVR